MLRLTHTLPVWVLLGLAVSTRQAAAFTPSFITRTTNPSASWSQLEMGKSRKARRSQKVDKSRPKSFFDVMDDAEGKTVVKEKPKKDGAVNDKQAEISDKAEAARQARLADAEARMEQRPDVSTMIVDDESGMEVVQQGKNVMDVVTRRPVKLSDMGPEYRLAQLFPGVPPNIREQYRLDPSSATVADLVQGLKQACSVPMEDGTRGIPPHPSVANKAIDFVLANRDLLGFRMKRTLGRLTMRTMASGDEAEGREMYKLWKNYETLENHISAPFRQMLMDGEGRAGPQFGNLEVKSFLNGDLYERTANYVVLKSMVAHWEKKVVDAQATQGLRTDENYVSVISEGDPRRFLPDAPILFTLKECTQVCYMAQQMTKTFVEDPDLFNDLPPEVRFLEYATSIKGGTPMRKYMKEEFCPAEGITPAALREGMTRLMVQLENMQIDPYADIVNLMQKLIGAMSVGTDDEREIYSKYLLPLSPNDPGHFPTYTMNHESQSLVKFFDVGIADKGGANEMADLSDLGGMFGGLFGGGNKQESKPNPALEFEESASTYTPPKARAVGRPHNLGWLDLMTDPEEDKALLGQVKAGRIIPDSEG